jgi:hypothetical protein
VYWIGGFPYPMPFLVQRWFHTFLSLLKEEVSKRDLRQENFVRFRSVAQEHTERFLETSLEYEPLAGFAIPPDGAKVKPPTAKDIEDAIKNGGFKLADWIGDYTFWFLQKQDERQRQDFFGVGGMLLLWLKPDPNAAPPAMPFPAPAQAWLQENGHNLQGTLDGLYRLQDGFLAKSKKVFGATVAGDPAYDGLPFVLPLLQARHFLEASAETLESWFTVFDGYLIESREDAGVLLAFKDRDFDPVLQTVLEQMQRNNVDWPYAPPANGL